MKSTSTLRTRYDTIAQAESDGWRRASRKTDRDISGGNSYGYVFESSDGRMSTTIVFTKELNRMGWPGCCMEMFRDSQPRPQSAES